ncbi:MAG: glycosyltransferase family 9 protein, partial [Myxococcales bacterium]|nr:glycosyltransferase family 9 protein [Myxococcales bacterium]
MELSPRLAAALKADRIARIVLIRPDRVGDLLWATPALRALRRRFPRAHLAVLASRYAREVVARSPQVDAVWTLDARGLAPRRAWARGRAASALRAEGFDLALAPSRAHVEIARAARVPFIVGTGPGLDAELPDPWPGHEAERDLALARALGAEPEPPRFDFPIRDDEHRWADEYLAGLGVQDGTPLLGIHPGCQRWVRKPWRGLAGGSTHRWKLWPPERHAALARRFVERTGGRVLVTGLPAEAPLMDAVVRAGGPGVLPAWEAESLGRLAALLTRLDVLVSGDTGPMHLATAVG